MSNSELSPSQRRYLTGLGHHLQPIVVVGKDGLKPGVLAALEQALLDHELVKVKVGSSNTDGRHAIASSICEPVKAQFVQMVGKTMLVYKAHPEKPTIKLPRK